LTSTSVFRASSRRPTFWGDDESSDVSRAADDEGTGVIERTASRGYGWDSSALVWRRISVNGSGELVVSGGVGGGGVQYTEGDTDASITGTAVLWEDASDTLRSVSAGKPLPVNAVTGSVTANAGSNLNTSALAVETGGNLAAAAASLSVLDDWDETDRAKVNVIAGQAGVAAGAGAVGATTQRVTLASDDPAVASLSVLDDWDETDRAKVNSIVGQAGVAGGAGAVGATTQRTVPAGVSVFRSLDLDETEEEAKASAGTVYGMWVNNTATATRFVKFYDATAANVVVGTTTPVITIGIPGNTSDDVSGSFGGGYGITFATAITVAATTGVADADVGAPGVNDVVVNVFYS